MLLLLGVLLTLFLGTLLFGLFWVLCGLFVYYTFAFARGSHDSGVDTFDSLRSLPLWERLSPVCTRFVDASKLNEDGRYIFIMLPNATNTGLMWGFGLHGSALLRKLRICYFMPNILFWVPLVREVLLLSGAVCADDNSDDRVIEMIRRGRNVAYAPNGMNDILYVHESSELRAKKPSMTLYTKAAERQYEIVPCMCDGDIYLFATAEWIRRIQAWFLKRIGYPFPLVFIRRDMKLKMDLTIGIPIKTAGKDPHTIQEETVKALKALNETGVSKQLKLNE